MTQLAKKVWIDLDVPRTRTNRPSVDSIDRAVQSEEAGITGWIDDKVNSIKCLKYHIVLGLYVSAHSTERAMPSRPQRI